MDEGLALALAQNVVMKGEDNCTFEFYPLSWNKHIYLTLSVLLFITTTGPQILSFHSKLFCYNDEMPKEINSTLAYVN